MKRYEVQLTEDAEVDLEELHDFIAEHDSPGAALHVLDQFEKAIGSLATMPDRGSIPRELSDIGIRDYRQVFFKPYRVIYRVTGQRVIIYVIADGRRDMQSLLSRRLLRA